MIPGSLAASFSPVLLSSPTQLLRQQRDQAARQVMQQAMRLMLCLLPFAGLVAGTASEVTALIYGDLFVLSGPILALLFFGAIAGLVLAVDTVILTAVGRPAWTIGLTWPIVPLALTGHLLLVPRFGATAAAAVTAVLTWAAAGVTLLGVRRQTGVAPRPATVARSVVMAAVAWALSTAWQTTGVWVVTELVGITAIIIVGLLLLGELATQDLAFARSLLGRDQPTAS